MARAVLLHDGTVLGGGGGEPGAPGGPCDNYDGELAHLIDLLHRLAPGQLPIKRRRTRLPKRVSQGSRSGCSIAQLARRFHFVPAVADAVRPRPRVALCATALAATRAVT